MLVWFAVNSVMLLVFHKRISCFFVCVLFVGRDGTIEKETPPSDENLKEHNLDLLCVEVPYKTLHTHDIVACVSAILHAGFKICSYIVSINTMTELFTI